MVAEFRQVNQMALPSQCAKALNLLILTTTISCMDISGCQFQNYVFRIASTLRIRSANWFYTRYILIKTSWQVELGKLRLLLKRLGSAIVNSTPPNGHTIDFASAKAIKKCIKLCVSYEMVAQQVIKCYTNAQNRSMEQYHKGTRFILKSQ